MIKPATALLLLFVVPPARLLAQVDGARTATAAAQPQNLTPAVATLPKLIPLHRAPEGSIDRTGLWTGGPDYKASFHDGFAFYPFIPGQRTSRALRWHTETLRVGERELELGAPKLVHGEYRCEFQHPGLLESYDIREDGVEQQFVVATKPATDGAITVIGRIDTPFATDHCTEQVGALHFCTPEGGGALVYGAASVIDKTGRRADVRTSFDGQRIALTVDAAFVATAEFPITIDPLTTAVTYASFTQTVTATAITAGSIAGNHRVLSCVIREFSATDHDVSAYLLSDAQSGAGTLVYVNNSVLDMDQIDAGEVDGTQSWVLAIRSTDGSASAVFLYQQPQVNTQLNSGTVIPLPAPQALQMDARVGGGTGGNTRAVIVWRDAFLLTDLEGAVLDTQTHTLTPFHIGPSYVYGVTGGIAVSRFASIGQTWRVLWADNAGNISRLTAAVVDASGTVSSATPVGSTVAYPDYARDLRLDGAGSRCLATYVTAPSGTNGQLHTLRFDLTTAGQLSNVHERVLATAASFPIQTLSNGNLAFDLVTMSHWAVTWRSTQILQLGPASTVAHIARLGYTGGVTASESLHPVNNEGVGNPSVAFDGYPVSGSAEGFAVNYSTAVSTHPVFFRRFTYAPPTGSFYGTSCRNNTAADGHPPYAGSEFYYRAIMGLVPGTPAVALVGFSPANLPLDGIGMTGCTLLVHEVGTLACVVDGAGNGIVTMPLPDDPLFLGDIYLQWAWVEAGANPLGVVLAGGERFRPQ